MPILSWPRRREPELMDAPDLDPAAHRQALRGLRRINALSRTVPSLWKPIRAFAKQQSRRMRVLDLACGGGDLAIALAQLARAEQIPLTVYGCDISPTAIAQAESSAQGVAQFFRHDLLNDPFPPDFDIVTCSLFLHHLDEAPIEQLFRGIAQADTKLFLASDLRRGRLAYGLAWAVTRLVSRSPIVHVDGPLSVRAAFTPTEMLGLAHNAGLTGATIRSVWPQRYLLRWERSS